MVDLGEEGRCVTWLELAAVVVLLVGLGAGAFLVAQRPAFWLGLGSHMLKSAWPHVVKYVTKRNTPEVEAEMQACHRRGGTWDNFRKKCRDK